ncbi:MAG: hypothetical protein GXY33_19445 [Phycisphaerae bacterium]|nr:hypothetical protein [Phycisphaerae bacterium]
MRRRIVIAAIGALLVLCGRATAGQFRFWIAAQRDWAKNTGFCLAFEDASAEGPCRLDDGMRFVLAVADGGRWNYAFYDGRLEADHTYQVKATIGPKSFGFWIDSQCAKEIEAGFAPTNDSLLINHRPQGYTDEADYIFVPIAMTVTHNETVFRDIEFPSAERTVPEFLVADYLPSESLSLPLELAADDTLVIESRIKIIRRPSLADHAPYVDAYGQWRHDDWPGKVRSDEDLRNRIAEEEKVLADWPAPSGYDKYGGCVEAGWKQEATGFFRVVRRDGFYWLISPEGHPCFYVGLCGVGLDADTRWPPTSVTGRESFFEWLPPREGPFAEAWMPNAWGHEGVDFFLPITANLIRKYGEPWRTRKNEITFRRMKAWGFSGGGKWARQNPDPIAFSWMVVLNRAGIPVLVRHPDVFDPNVCEVFEKHLAQQCEQYRENPWIIGLSLGNEDEELIHKGDVEKILAMAADVPAKRALVDHALTTLYGSDMSKLAEAWKVQNAASIETLYAAEPSVSPGDAETLRQFYADRYYAFVYQTIKKHDPNHLYCGFWIPGWRAIWGYSADWKIISRHCDLIGYDHYAHDFAHETLVKMMAETDKPVLCGEFGYAPSYDARRGFAVRTNWGEVRTDEQAGREYQRWMALAAENPHCVGAFLFCHHDQSCLGRSHGKELALQYGEAYAWGLVDVTDTPKWDYVRRVREANLTATAQRLAATKAAAGNK